MENASKKTPVKRNKPFAYFSLATDPVRHEAVQLLATHDGRSINNYFEVHVWPIIWPLLEAKVKTIDPEFFSRRIKASGKVELVV